MSVATSTALSTALTDAAPTDGTRIGESESVILFLDRAVESKTIVEALRAAGAEIRLHRDFFPPDALDTEWLPEVGRRGWIVVTKDARIRYRTLELQALKIASVGAFVLIAGNLTGAEMAAIFVKALPAMTRLAIRTARPFIAKIYRDGSLKLLDITDNPNGNP